MIVDLAIPGVCVGEEKADSRALSEDAVLVTRAASGDQTAFQALVHKYRPLAMRTAYGFLRDMDLARDVSQEAFVRVYGHLRRFDRSRPFATWLRRITVNLVIDELRRRRRRTEVPLEEGIVGADTPDPVTVAQTDESRHAVWDILEDMPLKYRLVMVLREIDGLPTDEIARIISRSEITVRWRLHYARKLFRERWVARFGEMEP